MEPTKISKEAMAKVEKLLRRAQYEMGMVLVKSWLIAVASVIPIGIISVVSGLIQTSFPFIAGLVTAVLLHVRYITPKCREIGDKYASEIKAIAEEEKRRQAEGR